MCTVTFIARKRGYALGMNRDEKLTRAAGLPPTWMKVNGRAIICPSESGGGTWIAVNDCGVTLALINWYAIATTVSVRAVSRGEVVKAIIAESLPEHADAALHNLPVERINPFRLIGVYPVTNEIVEWRWNLVQAIRLNHPWNSQQWISSGFDEPTAQHMRGRAFARAIQQRSYGRLSWLRRLHRSHRPEAGPFSTCMHRADAGTVSYSEVIVSPQRAALRYYAGSPCRQLKPHIRHLRLRHLPG